MSLEQPLDALAARWADHPHPTVCAALADGLRKRGDLRRASALLGRGIDLFPGHLPLWLTSARVALDRGDPVAVETALGRALAIDPTHPVAREMAAEAAPALLESAPEPEPETISFTETADPGKVSDAESEAEAGTGTAELVTESLAALYHRQGHLELALAAYSELAARDPANDTVAERHEAVRHEFAASRPLPFDARESGGKSTRAWLADLATVVPDRRRPAEFDAFYDAPTAPPDAPADFDAFQRWLQGLEK
jgi:tetratricopeptide (TPR) repeat protein